MKTKDYTQWSTEIGDVFRTLSPAQRVKTIHSLMQLCTLNDKIMLTERSASKQIYCDFFRRLPRELMTYILHLLDHRTLMICAAVSQDWRYLVTSSYSRWRLACKQIGASDDAINVKLFGENETVDDYYYNLYKNIAQMEHRFRNGHGLKCQIFKNEHKITALSMHNNNLVVCSKLDKLCFVDVTSLTITFTTDLDVTTHTVYMDNSTLMYIGANHRLCSCELPKDDENVLVTNHVFTGHTRSVTWIDCAPSIGIIITYSTDGTINVWSMDAPFGLVHSVILHEEHEFMIDICGMLHEKLSCYTLAIVDCIDNINVIYIKLNDSDDKESQKFCIIVSTITLPYEEGTPLLCFTTKDHLALVGNDLKLGIYVYTLDIPTDVCHLYGVKCGNRKLCVHQPIGHTLQLVDHYETNAVSTYNVRKLLGVGDRYALLFNDMDEMVSEYTSFCLLPLHKMSDPIFLPMRANNKQFLTKLFMVRQFYNQTFLDGFDKVENDKIFFAINVNNIFVYLYSFVI